MTVARRLGARGPRWLFALVVPVLAFAVLACFRTGALSGARLAVATGIPEAESSRCVEHVATVARGVGAHVERVGTAGPAEAIAALRAGQVPFAITPLGCAPSLAELELVAVLPVHVPLLLVGPGAGAIEHLRDLAGKRIAVGPPGSASATAGALCFARPELQALGVQLVEGTVASGLQRLRAGDVDLLALLVRPDAALVREALGTDGDVASIAEVEALAERVPFSRTGRVPAAAIDLGKHLPAAERRVLEFPLGVLCAAGTRRSTVVDMLRVLQLAFPGLGAGQQASSIHGHVARHPAAADFFTDGGTGFFDVYFPALADLVPLARFAQIALLLSLVGNLLDAVRRYRLRSLVREYRRLGRAVAELAGVDAVEVPLRAVHAVPASPGSLARLDGLIAEYQALRAAARRQSEAWTTPFEGDPAARAIELLGAEWEFSLRAERPRVAAGA